jgi:hypothetical protein
MVIMVITGIIGTTAGAVVIVAETEGRVAAAVLLIAEAAPAAETEGQVAVAVAADRWCRREKRHLKKTFTR